jgi:3-oxoacyl-(acyl-carrier-protein) synthase/acyl carrier protein
MSPDQGLTALRSVICLSGHPVITANPFIWDRFLRTITPVPPIFDSFVESFAMRTATPATECTKQAAAISEPPLALASDIQAKIAGCVRSILGTDVAIDEPLVDAGLDSLSAVELNDTISSAVGMELPSTMMFDYPSVGAMSDFVVSQIQPRTSGPATNVVSTRDNVQGVDRRGLIWVVGSSSRTSCDALKYDCPVDAITRVPLDRWSLDTSDNNAQVQARFGSFIVGIDAFDLDLFNMSITEGVLLDPQQRMLLDAALEVKFGVATVGSERSGVTVGISGNEYGRMADVVSAYTATGGALSVACGRISYTFSLQGICLAIDTACSSSLVGSHVAMQSIANSESDNVTSCGVNVTLSPVTSEMFSKAGMLSKDGRCKTLDASADGYVRGEACVALELRAPDKACPPSLTAGVLIASAVNQDGRSSSLTAPNGPSQQRTIRCALQTARIDSSDVDGLEMHGTGTSLGDPIEVGAAHAVLIEHTTRNAPLALSAMKSCMGHTEPSAGLAGLFCALRGTNLGSVGGICHLTQINPHLASLTRNATSTDVVALSLPRQLVAFAIYSVQRHNRGVSSFAFQGTNAHVVAASVTGSDVAVLSRGQTVPWRRERVWHMPLRHPLLQKAYTKSADDVARFDVCVTCPAQTHLCDHRVSGRGILPAAAFLEVATSAAILTNGNAEVIYKAAFTSPLVISSTLQHTVFSCAINQLDGIVRIGSTPTKLHQFTSTCTRTVPCRTQQANVDVSITFISRPPS